MEQTSDLSHCGAVDVDDAGFGIEMVQALDAAHVQDIARAQHPTGRLSVMPAELLYGQDRQKLLRAWLCDSTIEEREKPSSG